MATNVLLIGGGGREHALAWGLSRSPDLGTLFVANPENPGLASIGTRVDVPVDVREAFRLQRFCEKNGVGLVVIGPEEPLAQGMTDLLLAPGRSVFGPIQEGARLEADKAWAKQLMRAASIPTPDARIFTDPDAARAYVETREPDDPVLARLFVEAQACRGPDARREFIERRRATDRGVAAAFAQPRHDLPVVKASGLCKGKGVILPATLAEAFDAIDRMMVRREFGDSGRTILLEERCHGPEVSVLALVDGRTIYVLETAQDHKRLRDDDQGPNTGGMGAFSPSSAVDDALMDQVQREILVPTLDALRREGIDYRGVLYAGLMLTPAGPKVLEFNARFGDPECQAIIPRLESDLVALLTAACRRRLHEAEIVWRPGASCCVVLASEGYPDSPRTGRLIEGVDEAERVPDVRVFHSGTRRDEKGRLVTAGGRVLSVSAVGETLADARALAYRAADLIHFEGKHLRRDIGVERAAPNSRPPSAMTH